MVDSLPVKINGQTVDIPMEPGLSTSTEPISVSDIFKIFFSSLDQWKSSFLFDLNHPIGFIVIVTTTVMTILFIKNIVEMLFFPEEKAPPKEEKKEIVLRDFTLAQLSDFNGKNGQPVYIGLLKEVYDATEASDFYGEGACYNCFAGNECSRAMAKLSFAEEDMNIMDISDLSLFEKDTLNGWMEKFKYYKCYPIVGKVSVPSEFREYTKEELAKFDGAPEHDNDNPIPEGRVNRPLLFAVKGKVIDVSYGGYEMYGPGGPYNLFCGKDASRALAKMSFKPEDLCCCDISELTEAEAKTLQEWEDRFIISKKYPVVGRLV